MSAAPEEATEVVLARMPSNGLAHVYKLPPRPDASRGWACQQWPKENHIWAGRVVIVAKGESCTIKLCDAENGSLFAQCLLDNNSPQISVEPCNDSSRYFVLQVSDGSGRKAYLGLGFIDRPDAFEFNVTLQDHVRHLKQEKEAQAAASAPQAPPRDFSLTGSISVALPGGATATPKPRPAPTAGGGLAMALAPPPPGQPSRGRVRGAAAPAPAPAQPAPAADISDPFAASGFGASFSAADPFASSGSAADPFASSSGAAAADPFAPASGAAADPFGASTPFGAPSSFSSAPSDSALANAFGELSTSAPAPAPVSATEASTASGGGGWVAFGS